MKKRFCMQKIRALFKDYFAIGSIILPPSTTYVHIVICFIHGKNILQNSYQEGNSSVNNELISDNNGNT